MFNVSSHVKRFVTDAGAFARSYVSMAPRTTTWSLANGHRITKGDGRLKGSGGSLPG